MRGVAIFTLITTALGLILRWSFAGAPIGWLASLELYRAHSHLAYYGIVFPMVWAVDRKLNQRAPSGNLLIFYYVCVIVSTISFLLDGYNSLSKLGSTGVLAVWFVYAWGKRKALFARSWESAVGLSILLAAFLILAVAIQTSRDPALAQKLVRAFSALLFFGVFAPAALRLMKAPAPRGVLLNIAVLGSAFFLSELVDFYLAGLCVVLYAGILARGMTKPSLNLLTLNWLAALLALLILGLGLIPMSRSTAVAGVHFIALGPIFLTLAHHFLSLRRQSILLVYNFFVVLMCTAIFLMQHFPHNFLFLQKVAAYSGGLLVMFIALVVFQVFKDKQAAVSQR